MRGLIILCISTLAIAVPQGYQYTPGQQQQQHNFLVGNEGDIEQPKLSSSIQDLPEVQKQQQFSADPPLEQDVTPKSEEHFTSEFLIRPTAERHVPFNTYGYMPVPKHPSNDVVISKQFFLHSAPEEEDEEIPEKHLTIGKPRRNYNVFFIRAPVKQQGTASIKLIPAINEEKTIVYVLSKKAEPADIDAHIESLATTTTKPEVYFIKYKTAEEASHAQEKIQAEYDRLGGSTQVTNEGISPVSSVIGSLKEKTDQVQPTQETSSSTPPSEDASAEELVSLSAENGYLPPNYDY